MKDRNDMTAAPLTSDAPVDSIAGVGPKTAKALEEAGYRTFGDLEKASTEELLAVKGLGKKTLEKILKALGKAPEAPEKPGESEEPKEEKGA